MNATTLLNCEYLFPVTEIFLRQAIRIGKKLICDNRCESESKDENQMLTFPIKKGINTEMFAE